MHVACDLKTQNTVLHILLFLRPRVAKAPCIFESQLIILIQQSHQHSFILLIFLHFHILLCTCSIHLESFIFFILLYFSKASSFKKKGIPTRKIDLIKSTFSKRSAFHQRNREVCFCCIS